MGPDRNSCFKLGREGEAMAMVCKFPFSYHVTRVDFGQLLHFSPCLCHPSAKSKF